MRNFLFAALAGLAVSIGLTEPTRAANPFAKVEGAATVLKEMLNAPARGIPQSMLADAQGLVIIPNVVKLGFVVGVQRGEGVLLVRDEKGLWGWPRFITLTAGSVGWQIGVESSDFVLVFKTRKSVDGLLKGKFTIGADANAAIGPVGRQIGAATDTRLKAELYSYSRSRGLFAGVSLAGSALELDRIAEGQYYGSVPQGQAPQSAARLVELVTQVTTGGAPMQQLAAVQPAVPVEQLRQSAEAAAKSLYAVVDDQWRQYLAMPQGLYTPGQTPSPDELRATLQKFDTLVTDQKYRGLTGRQEFSNAHAALANLYNATANQVAAPIDLPPPPSN